MIQDFSGSGIIHIRERQRTSRGPLASLPSMTWWIEYILFNTVKLLFVKVDLIKSCSIELHLKTNESRICARHKKIVIRV